KQCNRRSPSRAFERGDVIQEVVPTLIAAHADQHQKARELVSRFSPAFLGPAYARALVVEGGGRHRSAVSSRAVLSVLSDNPVECPCERSREDRSCGVRSRAARERGGMIPLYVPAAGEAEYGVDPPN